MGDFKQEEFTIDSLANQTFIGYTDGDTWNGFACPYFEKKIAEEVLVASETNGFKWEYVGEEDSYYVRTINDPPEYAPEEFVGQSITVNGQQKIVYGIGAYSWIWEEKNRYPTVG